METLASLVLFGAPVWSIAIAIAFLIICFAADIAEKGYFAFLAFIALFGLYYWGGDFKAFVSIFTTVNIVGYLTIGFAYSFLKTYIAGRKLGKRIKDLPDEKDGPSSYGTKSAAIKEYISEQLAGNVFRWWFMWPISLITWMIGDLLKDVWDWIFSLLKDAYTDLLKLGVRSVIGKTK